MIILEDPLHQQDPRLKVERLWITLPIRRIAAVIEAVAAGAIKVLTLIRRVSNSVAFANPLAYQGSS